MNFYKTTNKHSVYAVLLIFAAAFVTRLPRLLSQNLFLNGDEAVLGIMAQNLLANGELPLFFLGQNYGLSTLEVFAIAPFLQLLGACDVAVKIPMLLLFATGCCFIFFFVKRLSSVKLALLAVGLFLILPSWQLWSMQARGGYLTAFIVYNALLYNWTCKQSKTGFVLVNSGLLLLIYLSQPLWIVALLPFIGILEIKQKQLLGVSILIFFSVVFLLPYFLTKGFWAGPNLNFTFYTVVENTIKTIHLLPFAFNGQYWLGILNNESISLLVLSSIAMLGLTTMALIGSFKQKRIPKASHWLVLGLVLILIQAITLGAGGARYLLPVFQVLIIYAILGFKNYSKPEHYSLVIFSMLSTVLSLSVLNFKPFNYNEAYKDYECSTRNLVNTLNQNGVEGIYSLDPLLQWQIMFYSNQSIKARWENASDRITEIPEKVDSIFWHTPNKTAFVGYLPFGYYTIYEKQAPEQVSQIDSLFFIYQNPPLEVLEYWNMTLNNLPSTQ